MARKKRGISWPSFLLGEGSNIQGLQVSLQKTIEHFNTNFKRVGALDDKIINNINEIGKSLSQVQSEELNIRDIFLELETNLQILEQRMTFIILITQHLKALGDILHSSSFHEHLKLLERSLFKTNLCGFRECETKIFSTRQGRKITIHRELLTLRPSKQILLSCKAASSTHVSSLHN